MPSTKSKIDTAPTEVRRGAPPAVYMMTAVICYSAFPALFALGNAGESPFLFTGVRQFSTGIAMCAFALLIRGKFLRRPKVRKDIASHSLKLPMLLTIFGYFGFVSFALAIAFVDISVAAILYETSTFFLILLVAFLFRSSGRYRANLTGTLVFLLPALAGCALVILSQNETPQLLPATGEVFSNLKVIFGVFLALLAGLCASLSSACTLKMGESIADKHDESKKGGMEEVAIAVVMTSICMAIAGVVSCVVGLAVSETLSSHQIAYAVASGLVVNSIAVITFRIANLKTSDLGVNAIAFATPLVALVWIWIFSTLDVPHVDYLIIGAMGITAANLLINVDASNRIAYKALVTSLWLFGAITYFTEGYTTDVPLELPVTVFILVLAFRVDRLVRRTGQEEEWVFDVFHRLRLLAAKGEGDTDASNAIREAAKTLLKIDNHKDAAALSTEYGNMVRQLNKAMSDKSVADEISSIRRIVDKLSHSRQQGSRLGEIVAILLAGALIVFGLLVFSGDREIYGEITSFVLSSVVVFLFFNILDLQKDREDETMVEGNAEEYDTKEFTEEFIVNFVSTTNRKKQQFISMGTSAAIVIVFVALFFTRA